MAERDQGQYQRRAEVKCATNGGYSVELTEQWGAQAVFVCTTFDELSRLLKRWLTTDCALRDAGEWVPPIGVEP